MATSQRSQTAWPATLLNGQTPLIQGACPSFIRRETSEVAIHAAHRTRRTMPWLCHTFHSFDPRDRKLGQHIRNQRAHIVGLVPQPLQEFTFMTGLMKRDNGRSVHFYYPVRSGPASVIPVPSSAILAHHRHDRMALDLWRGGGCALFWAGGCCLCLVWRLRSPYPHLPPASSAFGIILRALAHSSSPACPLNVQLAAHGIVGHRD